MVNCTERFKLNRYSSMFFGFVKFSFDPSKKYHSIKGMTLRIPWVKLYRLKEIFLCFSPIPLISVIQRQRTIGFTEGAIKTHSCFGRLFWSR